MFTQKQTKNGNCESKVSLQVSATPSNTGTFKIETVAQNGEYPAIAIDDNGNPHISYLG